MYYLHKCIIFYFLTGAEYFSVPSYKMSSSMNRQPTAVRGIYAELFLIVPFGKKVYYFATRYILILTLTITLKTIPVVLYRKLSIYTTTAIGITICNSYYESVCLNINNMNSKTRR